jgi:GNAT superfamily N-acetyltransferase
MMIGEASSADAKAIAQIHRAARDQAMPWLPVLHSPKEDLWFFKNMVLPLEKVLIARVGKQAVGFISFDQGWLNHLYIAPDRWGMGLGTKLLEAARSDVSHLQLWVFQGNAMARQFYSKHGFCEREFTDGQRNEEKVPDMRMEWMRKE